MGNVKSVIHELETQLGYHIRLVSQHNKEVIRIKDRLKKLKQGSIKKEIKVSDHAVVNYMRRFKVKVAGLDIEEVREAISDIVTKQGLEINGNGKLTIGGVTFVLKNHKVLTIYNKENNE